MNAPDPKYLKEKNAICVVGLGYIGLPTASLLATKGYHVHGVDVSAANVETINQGNVPIVEPDLDVMVRSAVQSGNLKASLQPTPADVFILAVPTPFQDGYKPDLSYIESASRSIAPCIEPGNLIILESTSPVGTTEKVAAWIAEERPELQGAFFAHCPERVLPGHILRELVENDRIVGGVNPASTQAACDFYATFVNGEILQTDSRTAEMAKLTENAFRDVNIAFANELSLICDAQDMNVWELIQLANRHPRVQILQPGPGVGGHCIAVDPWFIVDANPGEARLIRTAREVNDGKPAHVLQQVLNACASVDDPVVACLGLAFKANIDDLRESPALGIATALADQPNLQVLAVEPHIEQLPETLQSKGVELVNAADAVQKADVVLLLVDHKAFGAISLKDLAGKHVIDTRGVWNA